MKIPIALAVTLALLLAFAASATASAWVRVNHKTVSGQFATTVVSATVKHPVALGVKVKSKPSYKMRVDWDVVCSKGTSAASATGHFTSYGLGKIVAIHHPFTSPDSCTFSADAQLGGGGSLTVGLFKK